MPELPEVEVVRAGLEPAVTGATILDAVVRDPRALTRHDGSAADFTERLVGRTIAAAVRRGKFIWMPLSADEALVAHLGMSGQILLRRDADVALPTHARIVLDVAPVTVDAAGAREAPVQLVFVDQRTFGSMAIDPMLPTIDDEPAGYAGRADAVDSNATWRRRIPQQVSHIARDPLDPAFDDDRFVALVGRRRSGIKRILLDQGIVSGIGNIYADESLWGARLHGEWPGDRLPRARVRVLLDEVRSVLRRALEDGGTSFDAQYVNVNGQSGYFSQRLAVYGQQGRPCRRCGATIVREAFMNRSSHRCPVCQRRPRAALR
ncbi:bifunctional DNA-formamidopyrimidine glycosylase/DNA-(apurinic or apyrimidinic site) lyase [Curtobacterium ammoniigenes]|uniref:bifunctional DNA-formamidopyrimidine glycosylase/DNA-(apurinic or apyrimidinic site) lyase n=1 Tax=Curtobacterium ammoniigenes TaxID=395387 RepID=UPI00083430C2|nr:bifunctional DNA-formamidopyrimidine glycosylase/DNA-(apurinic or apyrimidinic site) lyase [Curtobacterium ammoniigenes]